MSRADPANVITWKNLSRDPGTAIPGWGWGPFLEGPEKFSHPESHSKISKLMITELFYSRIININRGSLHKRNFRRIHFSVFRYRWTKNGFTGSKSFRSFRETGPSWPGCHVIAKLNFVAFNKRAEIPANWLQPGSCNQALTIFHILFTCSDFLKVLLIQSDFFVTKERITWIGQWTKTTLPIPVMLI